MKKNKKDPQASNRPIPRKNTASTSSKFRRRNNSKQGQHFDFYRTILNMSALTFDTKALMQKI
jgi:hypothetical protein